MFKNKNKRRIPRINEEVSVEEEREGKWIEGRGLPARREEDKKTSPEYLVKINLINGSTEVVYSEEDLALKHGKNLLEDAVFSHTGNVGTLVIPYAHILSMKSISHNDSKEEA